MIHFLIVSTDLCHAAGCARESAASDAVNCGSREREVLHFSVAIDAAIAVGVRGMAILGPSGPLRQRYPVQ